MTKNGRNFKQILFWILILLILILDSMVKINILADALKTIVNAERKGKKQVLLKPVSKVLLKFLRIMQKHNYIGEF